MSDPSAKAVAEQLGHVTVSGAPLPAGLRAAAQAYGDRRVRDTFHRIAAKLEAGLPLNQAIASTETIHEPFRSLLIAAASTREIGHIVLAIGDHRERQRDLARMILGALLYPLFVLGAGLVILTLLMIWVVPQYGRMFEEFALRLPGQTLLTLWWSATGIWWLLAALGVLVACGLLGRLVLPRVWWCRALASLPLIGVLWCWAGIVDWARWMQLLLAQGLTLPESLRLAAQGCQDASVARASARAERHVTGGVSFPESLWRETRFPPSLIPFVIAGEKTDSLSPAFANIADLFEQRVRDRVGLFRTMLPPIAMLLVGLPVLAVIPSLFLPLISLLRGLSGF